MRDTRVRSYAKQLLRGVVDPLVLIVISELPMHGYSIAREIERRSSGYFCLAASTVYSSLRRLEKEGLVRSHWQKVSGIPLRRPYCLTDKGWYALDLKLREWEQFCVAAERVMTRG